MDVRRPCLTKHVHMYHVNNVVCCSALHACGKSNGSMQLARRPMTSAVALPSWQTGVLASRRRRTWTLRPRYVAAPGTSGAIATKQQCGVTYIRIHSLEASARRTVVSYNCCIRPIAQHSYGAQTDMIGSIAIAGVGIARALYRRFPSNCGSTRGRLHQDLRGRSQYIPRAMVSEPQIGSVVSTHLTLTNFV